MLSNFMGAMPSSDSKIDYLVSAIIHKNFESAKLLCEIFLVENTGLLALLYGLVNVIMKDQQLYRTIFIREEFRSELARLSMNSFNLDDLINLSQNEIETTLNNVLINNYKNLFSSKNFIFIFKNCGNLLYSKGDQN